MTSTIHPSATSEAKSIGGGTRVGALTVLGPGVEIGEDCHVGTHVIVGNGALIGDGVVLQPGARIGDGCTIGDHVVIGPNAVIGYGTMEAELSGLPTSIESEARIGASAFIASGANVGRGSVVSPGAMVVSDIPPKAIVHGDPARIVGYAESMARSIPVVDASVAADRTEPMSLDVRDCLLWPMPRFSDLRGSLLPIEFETDLPFAPKRLFYVYDVASEEVRGEHAHKDCSQFLLAMHGALSVVVDDGATAVEVRLSSPDVGLLMPPMTWGVQYKFGAGALLAVLASHPYDASDYIRHYADYLDVARRDLGSRPG